MNIPRLAREAAKLTGKIMINDPYHPLKFTHRVPLYRGEGVFVRFKKSEYRVVRCKQVDILTIFEIE